MGNVSDLHNKAMECVDHAVMERRRGNEKRATEFFEQALKFELNAIDALDDQNGLSWSILHRSAGWLALDCDQPRLAKELANKALVGHPHPKIAEELRDLLKETINREIADAMQNSGDLCRNVTERGRFVLGDLANSSKSPGSRDSAFDELWRFDPAREKGSSVFNWGEQPEDMRTESQTRVFDVLRVIDEQPEDMWTESPERFSPTSEDSEPSQLLILAERSIASSVYRKLDLLLPLQRQAPHWHDGGSVSKFGLKVAV